MAETVIPEARVIQAWCAVFSGHGGREDAAIVLGELKMVSGFYAVTVQNAPDGVRAFNDGCRSVYGHLLKRIERDSAATAVEREARAYRA